MDSGLPDKTKIQAVTNASQAAEAAKTDANQPPAAPAAAPSKLRQFSVKLRQLLGIRSTSLKESIEEVIEDHDVSGEPDDIDEDEKVILHNVISFTEMHVRDIMTPRSDIVYLPETTTLEKLQQTIIEKAHTRVPVCRGTLDDVRGFIHIKDLVPYLAGEKAFRIDEILRQALFVPPSMKLSDLLLHMRASRTHMAMVVDEYGGTCGLVTLEDLIEEIVGEIRDEHDDENEAPFFREAGNGTYEASGRLPMSDLEQLMDEKIVKEENAEGYDTLGGMLSAMLGRVPATGEVVAHSSTLEFEILDADARRIKRVLVRRKTTRRRKAAGSLG